MTWQEEDWAQEYNATRELPNGVHAGIRVMVYTTGLFIGLHKYGYDSRYCYGRFAEAMKAMRDWDGEGDPPGPWIKHKGRHNGEIVDRHGPGSEFMNAPKVIVNFRDMEFVAIGNTWEERRCPRCKQVFIQDMEDSDFNHLCEVSNG